MNTSTGRSAVILGSRSDIAQSLGALLKNDGWRVHGWARGDALSAIERRWDLCLIAIGQVYPVGPWHEQTEREWEGCVESNVLAPVRLLRRIWHLHNPGASIAFMAGANPNKVMQGYTAYATGKMALLKACEHIDAETPDAKFFALAPGTVLTKIHDATRLAHWPNPVLDATEAAGGGTPIERIYGCLQWAMSQPKSVIGGRNICASDGWDTGFLGEWLNREPARFKLRRREE